MSQLCLIGASVVRRVVGRMGGRVLWLRRGRRERGEVKTFWTQEKILAL